MDGGWGRDLDVDRAWGGERRGVRDGEAVDDVRVGWGGEGDDACVGWYSAWLVWVEMVGGKWEGGEVVPSPKAMGRRLSHFMVMLLGIVVGKVSGLL